jgi:hypothetical protein
VQRRVMPKLLRSCLPPSSGGKPSTKRKHGSMSHCFPVKSSRTSSATRGKGKGRAEPAVIDDDTVYLEDLEPGAGPSPQKTSRTTPAKPPPNPVSPTKPKFHDHDPYRLPEVDMSAKIAAATGAAAPDPRLATEDELRSFIDEMAPDDFDATSPEFRALPTAVQYEIVNDLRLRSRQASHARLQAMLRGAPTPDDFSRAQIRALGQRNALTMQVMYTNGMISESGTVPVRVAGERNREYTLVRSGGPDGGWVLGRITDVGTVIKPINVDASSDDERPVEKPGPTTAVFIDSSDDDEDDDMDMEEVEVYVRLALFHRPKLMHMSAHRLSLWTPTCESSSVRTHWRHSKDGHRVDIRTSLVVLSPSTKLPQQSHPSLTSTWTTSAMKTILIYCKS